MEKIGLTKLFNEFLESNINKRFTTSSIFVKLHKKRPKTKKHIVQSYLSEYSRKGYIEPTGWVALNGNRRQREYKVVTAPPPKQVTKKTAPEKAPIKPTMPDDEIDSIRLGKITMAYLKYLEQQKIQLEADLREADSAKGVIRGLQKEINRLHHENKDLKKQATLKVNKREVREITNENERLKKQIDQQNKELKEIRKMKQTTFKLSDVATVVK